MILLLVGPLLLELAIRPKECVLVFFFQVVVYFLDFLVLRSCF